MKPIDRVSAINRYLQRNGSGPVEVLPDPDPDLFLCVVIPAYKEDDLLSAIQALLACDPPEVSWEILVHVNYPENADETAKLTSILSDQLVRDFAKSLKGREDVRIYSLLSKGLPSKHAGVGLARKIGMDVAIGRMAQVNQPDGVLVAFDADASCSRNYLLEIVRFYRDQLSAQTANIYFEHPLEVAPGKENRSIAEYELYLRYFRLALEQAGHPHAIHTVGSSFTVRADAYARAGGMGRHKAGEDFYFLHKCLLLRNFYEINTVSVFPSARESDRVIFGTGATIIKQNATGVGLEVYDLDSFTPLNRLFSRAKSYFASPELFLADLDSWQELYPSLSGFLHEQDAPSEIARMIRDSASIASFITKFFAWFNVFRVLRYLNQVHVSDYRKKPVLEEACRLATQSGYSVGTDVVSMLQIYRDIDRKRGVRRIL